MTDDTLLRTGFGASSTAEEVAAGVDLSGHRAIVTGGAGGLGLETARVLASAGAEVTLAVRDRVAGDRAAANITASSESQSVHVAPLDLADRSSIAAFVSSWSGELHILVNNAGVMKIPALQRTGDGWEMQFAINHLGHFALALGLHDALAASGRGRVVVVSSSAHLRSPVLFEDIHFDSRPYDPSLAYAQSKTANVLFAVGAATRWAGSGVTANALMPGTIDTGLMRFLPPDWLERARAEAGQPIATKTPQQGAATSVLLATSPLLEGVAGRYFDDCNEAAVVTEPNPFGGGVADHAVDPENADRLWQASLRMVSS
jgi:NAD(P)-dependent dehydrogenase (short-subunit alcohol dehydrogenase family)